jgi:glycosyl transferase family 87
MEPKKYPKLKFHYAVIPLLYFPVFYFLKVARRAHEIDFGSYYAWAYGIRHGINPYISGRIRPLSDWLAIKRMPVANYPPTFILAFQPFTYLRIEHAFAIWSVINFVLLLVAVGLLIGMVRPIADPILLGAMALMLRSSHRRALLGAG